MQGSLAGTRFTASLLAAALVLVGGWTVAQAVKGESVHGFSVTSTVLAEGATGIRKPLEP